MGIDSKNKVLRNFPSMQAVLESAAADAVVALFPYAYVKERLEFIIDGEKKKTAKFIESGLSAPEKYGLPRGLNFSAEYFAGKLKEDLVQFSFSLKKVVNGSGVVVHTNLGRSCLSIRAVNNILEVASGYSNLEYDIASGKRGKRYVHVEYLLKKILGCEKAIVVNNNAAAVFMSISSFCAGLRKEVIVSRGELVEIGGSFRIPDIIRASGAILVEVGTTNRTRAADYESAINENTALLLKVHRSNFKITGFTGELTGDELSALGRKYDVPVMEDLGSGSFIDLRKFGLPYEPTAQSVASSGVDILTFSGDKLLGGPQAGIIAGKAKFIDMISANPMNRALRIDKMTLAALEAVLFEYLDPSGAVRNIPTLRFLSLSPAEIKSRAKKLLNLLKKGGKYGEDGFEFQIIPDLSAVGGGALPGSELETYSVAFSHNKLSASRLSELFRKSSVPVIGKIKDGLFLLDMRTVEPAEHKYILSAVSGIVSEKF